jgi:Mg-chelatase subunit ChlD
MKDTVETFSEIAKDYLTYAKGPEELVDKIKEALEREKGKTLDIVICLDTTGSMRDDIDAVRSRLIPMLRENISEFKSFRIGMVLYKDYKDEYLTKVVPFTTDFNQFQRSLNAIKPGGGGDIPEAVYEALYDGATKFRWDAESKVLLLVGDAPPHPRSRGKITKEMVDAATAERGIKVQAIILPQ